MTRLRTVSRAQVFVRGELAGDIARTPGGARFAYAPEYLARPSPRPVAWTMPPRPEPYEVSGLTLHPFFANLLPEGQRLDALVRAVKGAKDDLLSMLVAVGEDTIGDIAVRVGPPGDRPGTELDVAHLDEVSFDRLLQTSLAFGAGAAKSSVPGVQEKLSARVISLPVRERRTGEAILKLNPPSFPRLVENEHYFLGVARAVGVEAASAELVHDREGHAGLLVHRFDRVRDASGKVERLHQEDACQLLGRYPADKYAVSTRDVFDSLEICDAPLVERAKLLRLFALSYVIGNGDLHAKNVSVYETLDGLRLISPAYDVLSTAPYGDRHMALKIDGRDLRLGRTTFHKLGARFELRDAVVREALDAVVDGTRETARDAEVIGWDPKRLAALAKTIETRRAALSR